MALAVFAMAQWLSFRPACFGSRAASGLSKKPLGAPKIRGFGGFFERK